MTQREDSDLNELRLRYVAGEIEEPRLPGHDAKPVLWFLGTKIATHTLLGAALGSLGGLIQPSPTGRAFIQIFTALFMLATALHLLRVHPIFRYVILNRLASSQDGYGVRPRAEARSRPPPWER